jgi:hypothetical protein
MLRISPVEISRQLANFYQNNNEILIYSIVGGFLNLKMTNVYWIKTINDV